MQLQLSLGMAANPRTWPIFDGRVKPDAIELLPSAVFPSELFWRQLKFGDFDAAETLVRHGVKANRHVLETAARYSQEQGLTPRRVKLEEIFAPGTLDQ